MISFSHHLIVTSIVLLLFQELANQLEPSADQ